ncbi:MAG: alpha-ribazole phosphatase family protein [Pseudomonadota bacterium]
MALTFLRHTTPRVAPGTCYGQTDLDLADSFVEEAEAAADNMPPTTQIVTSPLTRCRRLAHYLADAFELPLAVEPRIIEMDFGNWENRPWADIPRDQLDAWAEDFLHARPHGGESVAMLRARTRAALSDWRATAEATLIVTHAGVIKAALAKGDRAEHFKTHIEFGGFIAMPTNDGAR